MSEAATPAPTAGGEDPSRERIMRGLPAAAGIAIGRAYLYTREELVVEEHVLEENQVDAEIAVWNEAVERSRHELTKILAFAQQRLGYLTSNIFEGQLLMIDDEVLRESVERRIRAERRNADFIVKSELDKYLAVLMTAADEQFRERIADLRDVKLRLVRNIQRKRLHSRIEGEVIIIAHALSPSDTVLFSRSDVLAYATDTGGITSHAAIISRSLKIPAVVGMHEISAAVADGQPLIVDGYRGLVILNPTEERVREYEAMAEKISAQERELAGIADLPCVTTDGHRVELSANAEFIDELDYVIIQGSRGIGLYRTEPLYLAKGRFPSEEEQYEAYRGIAQRMYPQSVIIRTFDIGGDKVLDSGLHESNPSLGWRGTRMMLDQPSLFKAQLRAILRASTRKNLKILFPMISSLEEIREAKALVGEAREELRKGGAHFDPSIDLGVMIEVPSAIWTADELAKEVSFFSIGTNDLTQYILAVDRSNDLISDMYQEFHPAILRAIHHVIDVGHRHGIWVGMCGEMAGNVHATLLLLGMGLDEFSVVPSILPEIKKIILLSSKEEATLIARRCLSLETTAEIRAYLAETMNRRFPDLLFPDT